MEAKCGNCWHFAKDYFMHRDCCTVDEDDEEETLHWACADDEPCNRWELDLCIPEEQDGKSLSPL